MQENRVVAVFAMFLICFALLLCRLTSLSTNAVYAQAANRQAEFVLPMDGGRGNFFDCHFTPLTGAGTQNNLLMEPTAESYYQMFDVVFPDNRDELYEGIQKSKPFLLPIQEESKDAVQASLVFPRVKRYLPLPIACHLLGYVNGEEKGIAGLEYACDALLKGGSTTRVVSGVTNVYGALAAKSKPRVIATQGTGKGIMLTIDATLQRVCEAIAAATMDKGSIVVIETETGRVRASVSMPQFAPEQIAQSLQKNDTSLINRSISSYSVGSVFKPLLAAAALENGIDPEEIYSCDGDIEVDGHTYRCAYGKGHGEVNLQQALAQSCNCYFVQLGLRLGGETILSYAENAGFGESTPIYGTLRTARGNLPTVQTLHNTGELASISFGQGQLMATPVQVASFINLFANDGVYIAPTFVEGVVNEYTKSMEKSLYAPIYRQTVAPETAEAMRKMLVQVITDGLGKSATPYNGGAGGKTGTAQTGRRDATGDEHMDAWFAGFYPAENPQYTIAVLLDSGTHSGDDAGKIFAKVANALRFFLSDVDN
ncbi:MAG: penicillin-binding protein 2 [Ruthenibacterium sp.]